MLRTGSQIMDEKKPRVGKLYFLLVFSLSFFLAADAYANHNVCSIKAQDSAVWVRVFDMDKDGNIKHGYDSGYFSRNILREGILKMGQTQELRSSNGEISYDYTASSDDRAYGANIASCCHDEVISIP